MGSQEVHDELAAALAGATTPLEAADRLCVACVDLLGVDGASISLVHSGSSTGTFGSSGELSRVLDELQFTYGEGPCLDAVQTNRPVSAEDLDSPGESRWPALTGAVLDHGVRAMFALPVTVASRPVGALDMYRRQSGPLDLQALKGGLWAAGLASLPLLDLMNADVDWVAHGDGSSGLDQLASLERFEVYQATGILIAAFDLDAADAVARLRAHAISAGLSASEVAYRILDRRIVPVDGELRAADGGGQQ